MNKFIKKAILLFSSMSISISLCACQENPDKTPVVSKNDGSFDAGLIRPADDSNNSSAIPQIEYDEEFKSTDGSVVFKFSINQAVSVANMPVVEVTPHFLSEEDVQRAAKAIYGNDAVFFEAEPTMDPQFSKEEIQDQILRWSPYTTAQSIGKLYGNRSGNWEDDADTIRSAINHLTLSTYPNAPSDGFRPLADWKFKKESHYFYGSDETDAVSNIKENEQIQVWTKVGEYFYTFQASKRDQNDYKLNNLYAHPTYASPLNIDYELIRAEKLRAAYPTEDQISFAKSKAQNILENMGLGDWLVDQGYVETYYNEDFEEHEIHVNAVPIFNNTPAVRRNQINNLKSEATYASNYYLTDANFVFSPDGELLNFELFSPVDVVQVINENVSTIPISELLIRAKEHLSLSDYYAYGFGDVADTLAVSIKCNVTICALEYGLTRMKVADTDDHYYYIPAMILKGFVEYIDEDTGSVYYRTENTQEEYLTLVAINAIDGTVINMSNE